MGKAQRDKGYRFERELVNRLKSFENWEARRVPLSGGVEGYPGDIIFRIERDGVGANYLCEAKNRKGGFKLIYDSLDNNDILFIKQDRHDPLAVMTIDTLHRIAKG